MNKKTASVFLLTACALVSPAKGADVYESTSDDAWAGFFVGLNAGDAMTKRNLSMITPPGTGFLFGDAYFQPSSTPVVNALGRMSFKKSNLAGGVQLGYNWQRNDLVFGLETDLDYLGVHSSEDRSEFYPCCFPLAFNVHQEASMDWLGSARARIGFAQENFLLFASGGLAFGGIDYNGVFSDGAGALEESSNSSVQAGWIAGVGVEWLAQENVSLRAEYLHFDLGEMNSPGGIFTYRSSDFPGTTFSHSTAIRGDVVRIGLNLKFN
jgi:outer membrane immunogenic protein